MLWPMGLLLNITSSLNIVILQILTRALLSLWMICWNLRISKIHKSKIHSYNTAANGPLLTI